MRWILPVIVISQFLCTSLWFAGNSVLPNLVQQYQLPQGFLAHITSAVQLGFIVGTLLFALLSLADRFPPSLIFFICSIISAGFNLGLTISNPQPWNLLIFRFFTGFFLAGIYPVGMKIASDYYQKGLGKSLGFLVGALVLGTAFSHLPKAFSAHLPWKFVVYLTSCLSVVGGLSMLLFVPPGPYRRQSQQLEVTAFFKAFRNPDFRSVALGYFGHMWELYAFWAFVPVMLALHQKQFPQHNFNVSLWSFLIIGGGCFACVFSGLLSLRYSAKSIASSALVLSGSCCLLSPLMLSAGSLPLLLLFLFFWGLVVIADSPLFSTLLAQAAPPELRGTSLTIINCIGFSITIVSIQLLGALMDKIPAQYLYTILAIGPVAGLVGLYSKKEQHYSSAH